MKHDPQATVGSTRCAGIDSSTCTPRAVDGGPDFPAPDRGASRAPAPERVKGCNLESTSAYPSKRETRTVDREEERIEMAKRCDPNPSATVYLAVIAILFLACGSSTPGAASESPSEGSEGADCYPNGTCNAGLSCSSNVCVSGGVDGGGAGGSEQDVGTAGNGGAAGTGGMGNGGDAHSLDGTTCTLGTSNNCDSDCMLNCGADPKCIDMCCTTTTSYGILCGDRCIDPNKDYSNCGACGNGCTPGKVCATGKCLLDCSEPPSAQLVTACEGVCAKMGPACGYVGFLWPGSTGGGNFSWTSLDQCKKDCLNRGNGPCSSAMAEEANCWAASMTCSSCSPGMCATGTSGWAHFPACSAEANTTQACLQGCAPR
jgi:hypothetical protein